MVRRTRAIWVPFRFVSHRLRPPLPPTFPPYLPAQSLPPDYAHEAPPAYPQQPGYPPMPPNYNAQYPAPRTGNGRATAGLVLGIASIVFFWLVFIDFALVATGIIFSLLGRAAAVRQPHLGGKRQATIGLVCSIIGLVMTLILLVFAVHAVQQCNYLPQNSSEWNSCVQHHLHLK